MFLFTEFSAAAFTFMGHVLWWCLEPLKDGSSMLRFLLIFCSFSCFIPAHCCTALLSWDIIQFYIFCYSETIIFPLNIRQLSQSYMKIRLVLFIFHGDIVCRSDLFCSLERLIFFEHFISSKNTEIKEAENSIFCFLECAPNVKPLNKLLWKCTVNTNSPRSSKMWLAASQCDWLNQNQLELFLCH